LVNYFYVKNYALLLCHYLLNYLETELRTGISDLSFWEYIFFFKGGREPADITGLGILEFFIELIPPTAA